MTEWSSEIVFQWHLQTQLAEVKLYIDETCDSSKHILFQQGANIIISLWPIKEVTVLDSFQWATRLLVCNNILVTVLLPILPCFSNKAIPIWLVVSRIASATTETWVAGIKI